MMPLVLIADEDHVQRTMAGVLLDPIAGFTVAYASTKADAAEAVRRSMPDALITDLQGVGALAFVKQARQILPRMPIIGLVSPGHEAAVVEALRLGVTTVVARSRLSRDLVGTVTDILHVAAAEGQHQRRFLDCFRSSLTQFTLDNDPALTQPMIGFLLENLARTGLCDESRRIRVGIALQEALSNAIIHGNLEVSSSLRVHDDAAYHNQVRERQKVAPYINRHVYVTAEETREQAVYTIRDEGPGFDVRSVADPLETDFLELPSGRGLLLIRSFTDKVEFNSRGNQITMTVLRTTCQV